MMYCYILVVLFQILDIKNVTVMLGSGFNSEVVLITLTLYREIPQALDLITESALHVLTQ